VFVVSLVFGKERPHVIKFKLDKFLSGDPKFLFTDFPVIRYFMDLLIIDDIVVRV